MKRALIAYSTWTGVSKSIAEEISKVFVEKGISSDLFNAKEVSSITEYDLIVLGTSIHAFNTVRGFNKFLRKFHNELEKKKTAFFVVCANMMEDNEENRIETSGWLEKATGRYPDIHPISIGLFGGAVIDDSTEYKKQSIVVRKIINAMKEKMVEDYGKSDFRDLSKVREWVLDLTKRIL